jgi:cyclase
MSNTIRIIPRLDIKGPNLVKGIHFEGLRVLGKPEHFAQFYNENGADELIYMDAVASLYERNSLVDIIKKTSKRIFIPLTVGGGLRSIEDVQEVLHAGADRVSINTAAVKNPGIIKKISRKFGSSTLVVSIDAIKNPDGSYEVYVDYGRQKTGRDAYEWAVQAAELGAGELMVTSINQEGTGKGFDLELTKKISESVSVPVIACGGAGTAHHMLDVIREGKADAVAVASILHYNFIKQYEIEHNEFACEGNIEHLKSRRCFSTIEDTTINEIKNYLSLNCISCRPFIREAAEWTNQKNQQLL